MFSFYNKLQNKMFFFYRLGIREAKKINKFIKAENCTKIQDFDEEMKQKK